MAKKKRKRLDMANKKRNNPPVLRGGLCLQFFPPRRRPLVFDAATLDNPPLPSFLFAQTRQAQHQRPATRCHALSNLCKRRKSPALASAVRVTPRRLAPRPPLPTPPRLP